MTPDVFASALQADPGRDYDRELFGKAETLKPGSQAVLTGKALLLTGGPERVLVLPMVAIPEELSAGYDLLVRNDAPVGAWRLAMQTLSLIDW